VEPVGLESRAVLVALAVPLVAEGVRQVVQAAQIRAQLVRQARHPVAVVVAAGRVQRAGLAVRAESF
jgi:hypothetical protein